MKSALRVSLLREDSLRQPKKSVCWGPQLTTTIVDVIDELSDDNDEDLLLNNAEVDERRSFRLQRKPSVASFSIRDNLSEEAQSISEESESLQKQTKTFTKTQNSPVFFMVGCQRSGSNWLRTMLSQREDLIAPHPPKIMRDYMPKLGTYGDLTVQDNLKVSHDYLENLGEHLNFNFTHTPGALSSRFSLIISAPSWNVIKLHGSICTPAH